MKISANLPADKIFPALKARADQPSLFILLVLIVFFFAAVAPASANTNSIWVYYTNGTSGPLTYKPLPTNPDNNGDDGQDQIMDFSGAGYGGGGVTLPISTAPVEANVSPSGDTSGKTDTSNIQKAIKNVSALGLSNGFRGEVLLAAGCYYINAGLTIQASGVVLRGAGDSTCADGGSQITMVAVAAGGTPYPFLAISGSGTPEAVGDSRAITDQYVPAGALTVHVTNASTYFAAGDTVLIKRPVTADWVTFMGMNDVGATWLSPGSTLNEDRTIQSVSGNTITLDVPVSDSIDSIVLGQSASVLQYSYTGRISNVGLEYVRVIAPAINNGGLGDVVNDPSYQLVTMQAVIDSWVHDVIAQDTLESIEIGTQTNPNAKRITVSDVDISHTVTQSGTGALFEELSVWGTQVLFDTIKSTADNQFFFSTESATQGPNVLRNSTFNGNISIEPHQRWATGLLVENTTITGDSDGPGYIDLRDRGTDGPGQGWTIGWGVVWNSTLYSSGAYYVIQAPPGSENWCIGCIGTQDLQVPPGGSGDAPQGEIDSSGSYITNMPGGSLYQAQLNAR